MKRKRKSVVKRGIKKASVAADDDNGDVQVDPAMYSDVEKDDDEVHVTEEIETRETSPKKSGERLSSRKTVVSNVAPGSASAKLARALSSSRVNATTDRVPLKRPTIGQKEPKSSRSAPLCNKQELDAALSVITKIMEMDAAVPFITPVDPIALGIPDYFDIIETPMDFGTICSKIERGLEYKNSEDVLKDVQRVWDNCAKYNNEGSHILELMKRVKANFMKQWAAAGLYKEQCTASKGHLPHSIKPFAESAMRHEEEAQMSPVGSTRRDSAYLPHYSSPYLSQGPHNQQFPPSYSGHPYNPGHMPYQYPGPSYPHDMVPQHSHSTHMHPRHGYFPHLPPPIPHLPPMDPNSAFNHEHAHHLQQQSDDRNHLPNYQMGSISSARPYRYPSTSHVAPTHQLPQSAYDRFHTSHLEGGENIEHPGNLWMPPVESTMNCNTKRGTGNDRPRSTFLQANELPESSKNNQEESSPSERLHSLADNNISNGKHQVLDRLHIQEQSSPTANKEKLNPVGNSSHNKTIPIQLGSQTDSLADMDLLAEMDALEKRRNELLTELRSRRKSPIDAVRERTRGDLSSKQKENLHLAPVPQSLPASGQPTGPSNLHAQSEGPVPQSLPASGDPTYLSNLHTPSKEPSSNFEPLEHSSRHHSLTHSNSNSHQSASTPNFRQGSPSQSCIPLDDDVEGSSDNDVMSVRQPIKRKGRGRAKKLMSSDTGPIRVEINDLYQPVGENAAKLSTQMGCAVRNGKRFSLTVPDWRKVDKENKEKTWNEHKAMFTLEDNFKAEFMKRLGLHWKDWKSKVKKTYYLKYTNDVDRLANCPAEVEKDQWPVLVSYWSSEASQRVSDKNKSNRSKQKVAPRTGKHSFAVVKHKLTKEKGEEPSKFDFWMATHIESAKTPLDKETDAFVKNLTQAISENPEAMESKEKRDELLSKFLGPEKSGQMWSYGFGPTHTQVRELENRKKMVDEKVSVLVSSIKNGLKDELKVELRGAIEEIVRDLMRSIMNNKSPGDELSGSAATRIEG